jgi:hypothetical protein
MTSLHEATGIREFTEGVSFCAFRQLAARRGWSVAGVLALLARHGADDFGGPRSSPYYESPRRYLARVLDGRASRDTDELVIPYRGLIALYVAARVHEGAARAWGRRLRLRVWPGGHGAAPVRLGDLSSPGAPSAARVERPGHARPPPKSPGPARTFPLHPGQASRFVFL